MAQSQNECDNIDLENSDFSSWKGRIGCPARGFSMRTGATCPHNSNNIDATSGVDGTTSQHEIISSGFNGGFDPQVPALSVASPLANFPNGVLGNYVARIGNYAAAPVGVGGTGAAQSAELTYDIFVDKKEKIVQIAYAVVLESPGGHAVNELPYFSINVLDANGAKVQCMQYEVVGQANTPGFKGSGGYVYKDWTIASLYLGDFLGTTVTVEIQTSDCYLEAHAGWAYVDANCNEIDLTATVDTICEGDFTELRAPEGMETYKWYFVSDEDYRNNQAYYDGVAAGNFGATGAIDTMQVYTDYTAGGVAIVGRRMTYNRPGHYFVEMTPFSTSGVKCPFRMHKEIIGRPTPNPGYIVDEPLCQGQEIFLTDTTNHFNVKYPFGYEFNNPDPNVYLDTGFSVKRFWFWDTEITGSEVHISGDSLYHKDDSLFLFADNKIYIDSLNYSNNPNIIDTSGLVRIGLRHINNYGCEATFFYDIEIIPIDTIEFTDPGPLCSNQGSVQLEANPRDGSWDGETRTWSGDAVSESGLFDPSFYAGNPGTYWVYLEQLPCNELDSMQVTVQDPADASFIAPPHFCPEDSPLQIVPTTLGGTFSGNFITPSGYYDPRNAPEGLDTIYYNIYGNCPDSSFMVVDIIKHAPFEFTDPGSQCLKDVEIQLTMIPSGGLWTGTGITNSSAGLWNPQNAGLGTHNITYSLGGTCPVDTVVALEVIDNPDPSFTLPDTLCNDAGIIDISHTQAGGKWRGPGIADRDVAKFNPGNVTEGDQKIYYEFLGSCAAIDSQVVYVGLRPLPNIEEAGPFCDADTIYDLDVNLSNGVWSGPGIVDAATGGFNPFVSGTGNITVRYDMDGVCPNFDTEVIEVTSKLVIQIQAQQTSFCDSEAPYQLSATPANGIWTGNGMSSTGVFDPGAAGLGPHQIVYRIPGICGGSDTIVLNVTQFNTAEINPIPALCPTASAVPVGLNPTGGTLTGTGVVNNSGTYYFDPSVSGPGSFDITYRFTGACAKDSTITVVVADPISLDNLTPSMISCNGGADGALNLTSSGGLGPHSYSYNPSPSSGANSANPVGFSAGTIQYTITDSIGCTYQGNIALTEPQALAFGLAQNNENCGSGDADASAINVTGGTGNYHYQWSNGDTTATIDSIGAGNYTVTVSDDNGCSLTQSLTITTSPPPIFSLTANNVTCYGLNDGDARAHSISNVVGQVNHFVDGLAQPNDNINNLRPGTYTWRIEDQVGCAAQQNFTISQPQPVLTAIPYDIDTICINDQKSITASISGGNPGGYSPVWTDGSTVLSNTTTLNYDQPGDYYFYANDNANICPSDTMVLRVGQRSLLTVQGFAKPSIICSGERSVLTAEGNGGNGNYTFTWYDENNNYMGEGNTMQPTFQGTEGNPVTVEVEINDGCSPAERAPVSIDFHPNPSPNLVPSSGCEPFIAELQDNSNTASEWNWTIYTVGGNEQNYSGNNVSTNALDQGDYIVELSTKNQFGCSSFNTFTNKIYAHPLPEAKIVWNPTRPDVNSGVVNVYNFNNLNVSKHEWTYHNDKYGGTVFTDKKNIAYRIQGSKESNLYVDLKIMSPFGCLDSASVMIKIDLATDIFVPNTFSPNNDGLNEEFKPVTFNIGEKGYFLMIFDRWGEMLFSSKTLDKGWDGSYMGEIVKPGVYVWRIIYLDEDGEKRSLTGNVNVIR